MLLQTGVGTGVCGVVGLQSVTGTGVGMEVGARTGIRVDRRVGVVAIVEWAWEQLCL